VVAIPRCKFHSDFEVAWAIEIMRNIQFLTLLG